jgi:hypothetical protein
MVDILALFQCLQPLLGATTSNSHFSGALAGLGFGRRVREAAQHENEQRVPTVAPHLTVVTLPLPLLVAVSAWVDVFGTWVRPKGAGGP